MTFFNPNEPLLRWKQEHLDIQDLEGLWRINWKIGSRSLFYRFYTRIDQIFVIWGLVTAAIFATAQFFPISWSIQAIFWSGLTLFGTLSMTGLAWFWVTVERLRWVVYWWALLMVGGAIATDMSILYGWGQILIRLCPLWLGLTALGYIGTGVGLRSRTFLIAGTLHLVGIAMLPYFAAWQFLTTGIVMAGTLLLLAEVQWDMRPPVESDVLTPEQRAFNREQNRLRQLGILKKV